MHEGVKPPRTDGERVDEDVGCGREPAREHPSDERRTSGANKQQGDRTEALGILSSTEDRLEQSSSIGALSKIERNPTRFYACRMGDTTGATPGYG